MPPPTYREKALKRINGLNEAFLRMYQENYAGDQRRFSEQSRQYISDIEEALPKVASDSLKRSIQTWFMFNNEHNSGQFKAAFAVLDRYVNEFMHVPEVAAALKK